MKRVTFSIRVLGSSGIGQVSKPINGYEVCAGLAAHRPNGRKTGWTVSHISSGCSVSPTVYGRPTLAQVKSWIDQAQLAAPIDWTFEGSYMPSEALKLSNKWVSTYLTLSSNY